MRFFINTIVATERRTRRSFLVSLDIPQKKNLSFN